ncbi:MAG: DNA repair protein RecN [Nitrospirae bacterium]|nr:DNA repair protein RecN [Nitrospirota bacterium]
MLRELRIRNLTIIDELSVNFSTGLNVLTGETGAGKSIIVGALGLIFGERASQDMIKTGRKDAHVEAYFDDVNHPSLNELSIESEDGVIIRRSIQSNGKGKAFINDTPVSINTLASVGRSLIDIHGQHEHQSLFKKESHLAFLDGFGNLTGDVSALNSIYKETAILRERVSNLKEMIRQRSQRIEFLKFQINEIDSAMLKIGEKESLDTERAILHNAARLKELSERAYSALYESEGSAIEGLSVVLTSVKDMAAVDPEAAGAFAILKSAIPQIEEAAVLIRKAKDKYDIDPRRLDAVEERLEFIKKLEKKYGETIEEILKFRDNAASELNELEHIDEQQSANEADLTVKEMELFQMAEVLSGKRAAAAGGMEGRIAAELFELGFQKAVFKIDIKKRDSVSHSGIDDVEFLFSANPGEQPRPLARVASGGELSRIMLALKCIEISQQSPIKGLESKNEVKTLIFDEVDAGIGGVTAQHVGDKLKAVSNKYQVLCITHLPQIAAMADHHMKAQKTVEKETVKVEIDSLKNVEREREIARMMSGKVTDVSLKHARELLSLTKTAVHT